MLLKNFFFHIWMQLYNNLNHNEYKIIIILIKTNLCFLFIKESNMKIYYCIHNLRFGHFSFSNIFLGYNINIYKTNIYLSIAIVTAQWQQ